MIIVEFEGIKYNETLNKNRTEVKEISKFYNYIYSKTLITSSLVQLSELVQAAGASLAAVIVITLYAYIYITTGSCLVRDAL
jgi:hypothetical protein